MNLDMSYIAPFYKATFEWWQDEAEYVILKGSNDKGDPAKGNALPLNLSRWFRVAPGRTKKFRKTLTILDSTISSTDNMADELLQKPQNVKAPLGTSHADQFAYHMIFIKKKRNRKKVPLHE
ncbi:hypothetical protein HZH66_014680 [Vespula vulgaris]|uniref:Uncharacterized protein n=1 Tax=Vespula vulgaris TaxID=7454 RepID=A0A834MPT6_VESVU|nr:hypothetical protein HZH66_014680 [Vespula vulgaris]